LKERVKVLEEKDGVIGDKSRDDAQINGRSNNEGEAPAERISNDSEEIARVLTSIDAATVLAGEANVPTGSGFIPTAGPPASIVSTGSKVGPRLDASDTTKTGSSFASLLRPKSIDNKVHLRTLVNEEKVDIFDCVLPKAMAAKITRNDDGVYLFKFASKSGMEQVLEKGPWMIRKPPIVLNKWTRSVSLKKGEVTKVPVWIKLYNVLVLAYSEDGLSLIATQIAKPIMLDAFTSSMCVESWGRISFARALIEISAHSTLKKEVIMAIPEDEGDGHIKEVIRVEYEWKPPHCVDCKSFGHDPNLCPKCVREVIPKTSSMAAKSSTTKENEEGFVEVKIRKKKRGADSRSFGGLRLPKPNSKVIWKQKRSVGSKGGSNNACHSDSTNKMVDLKVSNRVGMSSSNSEKVETQEEGLWSRFKKAKENAKHRAY
nr:hypothetical protein [Tanacetum cinerariifolium]